MPAEVSPAISPAPLNILIQSVPAKSLMKFIKDNPALGYVVFQGFSARDKSLEIPQVRLRIIRELEKAPELAQSLYECWQSHFQRLLDRLDSDDFTATQQSLLPFAKEFSEATLQYALLHANTDAVRACAEQVNALYRPVPRVLHAPASKRKTSPEVEKVDSQDIQQRLADLNSRLQFSELACASLQVERDAAHKLLQDVKRQLAEQAQQCEELERRLAREHRRAKKAEEDAELLRKALRREQQTSVHTAPADPLPQVNPEVLSSVREALTLLQTALAGAGTDLPEPTKDTPKISKAAPSAKRVTVKKVPVSSITLPTSRGKESFTMPSVLAALRQNDLSLLERIRNGIALLANTPQSESTAVAEFTKAGIPTALLNGPLRPAVIDGSNIAHITCDTPRAHIAFIQQTQRAAWSEGYFPVYIIVDASLRHQIDRPDQLMDMIERGEIMMASAGTSADALLIEEAANRRAVLITNDRMTDWPAAQDLEKRHVELIGGNASLSGFHRSSIWFR